MHNAQPNTVNLFPVAKKRSSYPNLRAFGVYLQRLRGRVSRERISKRLEKLGVPLGGSTLRQYELGAVWAPDPGVLWGLSQIYTVSLDTLIDLLRENRRNPKLEPVEVRLEARVAEVAEDLKRFRSEFQLPQTPERKSVTSSVPSSDIQTGLPDPQPASGPEKTRGGQFNHGVTPHPANRVSESQQIYEGVEELELERLAIDAADAVANIVRRAYTIGAARSAAVAGVGRAELRESRGRVRQKSSRKGRA